MATSTATSLRIDNKNIEVADSFSFLRQTNNSWKTSSQETDLKREEEDIQ